jgi:hypothetical protein
VSDLRERLRAVLDCWINPQLLWFTRRAQREEGWFELLEFLMKSAFWVSIAGAAALGLLGIGFFFDLIPEFAGRERLHHYTDHHELEHRLTILFVIVAAVIAALLHHYLEKSAVEAHAKQYERMRRIFRRSRHHLDDLLRAGDPASLEAAKAEILLLGREALAENGDWVLTHRERPLEVPHH